MELFKWLVEKVPAYMVPASLEMLDALPLTPNGKVNVKALPIPAGLRPVLVTAYAAPQSQLERSIASIWQTVLKVDKVGIQDNFFELGGNSLLIAQVHRRLQAELDSDLALVDLFKYPTIGSLAQRLSQRQAEDSSFQNEISQAAQKRSEALNRRKHLRQGRLY